MYVNFTFYLTAELVVEGFAKSVASLKATVAAFKFQPSIATIFKSPFKHPTKLTPVEYRGWTDRTIQTMKSSSSSLNVDKGHSMPASLESIEGHDPSTFSHLQQSYLTYIPWKRSLAQLQREIPTIGR